MQKFYENVRGNGEKYSKNGKTRGNKPAALPFLPAFVYHDKGMAMKRSAGLTLAAVVGALAALPARGDNRTPWWFSLEQGVFYFRGGNYGDALNAFETARRARRDSFTRMEQNFIILLSNPEVRPFNDDLGLVEMYIDAHSELDAREALTELYYRIPQEKMNNSVKAVLAGLARLKDYPEAEYWIGETYEAEGEPVLALRQYEKAYAMREVLETPGFDAQILYKTAELNRLQGSYNAMEKAALQMLSGAGADGKPRDPLWANEGTRQAMADILGREDGVNRFLTIYRYQNREAERAHRMLGFYYYDSGRHSPGPALEHLLFSFLIQNTAVIEAVINRQYDFTFTTLDNLMDRVERQPALLDYLESNDYYQVVDRLAASLYGENKTAAARSLWAFLAARPRAGQWQARARRQLVRPEIERPSLERQ
ncbi:MAG: hypothetical protein MdMp014T_0553 [Treponematales bacterium]